MENKYWLLLLGVIAVAIFKKSSAVSALTGVVECQDSHDVADAIDRQSDVIEAGYRS